jgi:prepilin-type processing-associated H-X9-DG protein
MNEHSPEDPGPPQFTLGAVFVVIAVVALLLGIALPAIRGAREAARRSACLSNLKYIDFALHSYHDTHRSFPLGYTPGPKMQPWSGWRVAISLYSNTGSFYRAYRFDEPWDSRNNRQLAVRDLIHCYQCPSEQVSGLGTSYVAVLGPRTAWPAPEASRLQDFSRGLSSVILVSEMSESGICWSEPRDLQFDQMEFEIYAPSLLGSPSGRGSRQAVSSVHPGGVQVAYADGHVDFLSAAISSEVLREMFLIKDGEGEVGDDE